ncbi:Sphingosine N-acyltransferase lag1 [Podospora bellae-mahoneyi]|uniref:Sphingosine N-acyltransferase lag1 n=1 Tax=Podospora bellae-mahoneyi TaxID=2093777 RepID=A0ABR0FSX4_9PEZI|nr:Sphingosine N-acyltransferase lag1 [Podospora bellae-mahoneyi]
MSNLPAPISQDGSDQHDTQVASVGLPQTAPRSTGKPNSLNVPLYMQRNGNKVLVRRPKRKDDGALKGLARWFVANQIGQSPYFVSWSLDLKLTSTGLSCNLVALLFLAHSMPRAREYTSKFFTLSYYNQNTGKYFLGGDDWYLIAFFIVVLTGLRAGIMEYVLAPFARAKGVHKKKDIVRFSEQGWLLVYYSFFWPLGVYIYRTSTYYLSLHDLWKEWPNREMDGLMKAYTLAQLSFYLQLLIVINIEERRKDHWQMFSHHIVTSTLIYAAYREGHTRVGNLILVLMDVVDIFLPFAKCLKYLGYKTICDVMFAVFMVTWFIARHIFFPMAIYSVWAHTLIYMNGCFYGRELDGPHPPPANDTWLYIARPLWDTDAPVCFNHNFRNGFFGMLFFLQILTVMWFYLIIRVAIKVIKGGSAEDTRSDDEADDLEDPDEYVYEEAQPLEEEVGADEIDLKSWERRVARGKRSTTATGVSLPGHSDRKELLGRIGCEKQVD